MLDVWGTPADFVSPPTADAPIATRPQLRRTPSPQEEVGSLILAYFIARIAEGRTVFEIADTGLMISTIRRNKDGSLERVLRWYQGSGLERRYRKILAREKQKFAMATEAVRRDSTRFIGISAPEEPFMFSHGIVLKAGRPKKTRSSKKTC